ncbi:MAG: lysophospholipid acyltransferase family protein [Chthoniobacterales bacterium]|nr:lysophospholipid acyltransferase family protein [Chthoniobacterales bacterium]
MSRERILAFIGSSLLKALFLTIRLRLDDRGGLTKRDFTEPCLICFWHNRILGITCTFHRRYPKKWRRGVTVLTSPSRDGEILAQLVADFGMRSVRGSSSRRGSRALLELVRILREKGDIAITPDGPRGPRYALGPGIILLAQTTGAPIIPMHASFSRSLRMKTWDGFIIPLPFSTISVTVAERIDIPKDLSEEEFEQARKNLEDTLKNAAD